VRLRKKTPETVSSWRAIVEVRRILRIESSLLRHTKEIELCMTPLGNIASSRVLKHLKFSFVQHGRNHSS